MKKLLPNFLRFNEKKQIVDIKIDEQRHVLYSLSTSLANDTEGHGVIEVFDLGVLANKFKLVTTIRQYELVKRLHAFLNLRLPDKSMLEAAAEY